MKKSNNGWKQEWPTKEGTYWFYGHFGKKMNIFTEKENKRELCIMEVRKTATGAMLCIAKGQFVFEGESEMAYFIRAYLPDPPVI